MLLIYLPAWPHSDAELEMPWQHLYSSIQYPLDSHLCEAAINLYDINPAGVKLPSYSQFVDKIVHILPGLPNVRQFFLLCS